MFLYLFLLCATAADAFVFAARSCVSRDGQVVTSRRNVPLRHGTNLCKQAPVVPSKCTHPHGMLMNLQGAGVKSLYDGHVLRHRDEIISKTGAGLFINGGNPIYYTSKGTTEDVAQEIQVNGSLMSMRTGLHGWNFTC